MAELREVRRIQIGRIEIRRSIIRRKEDEGVEEGDHFLLLVGWQVCERLCRLQCLASMPQDYLFQVDTPPVVPIGCGTSHRPQRGGQEFRAQRAVIIALVEVQTKIVTLEVGKDILDQESTEQWPFQRRKPAAIIGRTIQGGRVHVLCQQIGETLRLFSTLGGLFPFHLTRMELSAASDLAAQLLQLAESAQDRHCLMWAHTALGGILWHLGELAASRVHLE